TIVCTARYAAPEQLAGRLATNESDIFAWGTLIAQYAAFGAHPFGVNDDEPHQNILRRHHEVTPAFDGLSGPLADAVRAALSIDPSARHAAYDLLDSTARIGAVDDDPDRTRQLPSPTDDMIRAQPPPDDDSTATYLRKVHERTLRLLSRALS